MREQAAHRSGAQTRQRLAGHGARHLQEVHGQQRDIRLALPQRRYLDARHPKTVQQILAETAGGDLVDQMTVGGGDDADIDRPRLGFPHPCHLALLQHPEQRGLNRQRHVADFVEENRAARRCLEQPLVIGDRPGKGALAVAEQLTGHQGFAEAGRVDGDEGALPARAGLVDGPRHQFLARTGLAFDQHGPVAAGDIANLAI